MKTALNKAVARANSVTNALLSSEKEAAKQKVTPTYNIASVVQDIAIEKRSLFVGGEIEVDVPKNLYATSRLSSDSLARVLSNIVDNAMLACDAVKRIKIAAIREKDSVLLTIADSGHGIPREIISRLGQKGVSFRGNSKESGTGRGVYAAKNTINEAGGSICFESTSGHGTTVSIRIPITPAAPIDNVDLILVDNEEMIRLTWELGADGAGLNCKTFASINELLVSADQIPKTVPVFLDSDLGHGLKGQDFAQQLRELGFKKVILATA